MSLRVNGVYCQLFDGFGVLRRHILSVGDTSISLSNYVAGHGTAWMLVH